MPYVLSNLLHLQTRAILLLLWRTTWNAKPHLRLALGSKAGAQRVHGLHGDRGRAGSQAPAHQVHEGVPGVEGGDVVHQLCQALERHELVETKEQEADLYDSHRSPTPLSFHQQLHPFAPVTTFYVLQKPSPALPRVKITKQPRECLGYSGV